MQNDQPDTVDEQETEEQPAPPPETGASADEDVTEQDLKLLSAVELVPLLEDARAKADEHWDQLLRSRAEIDNIRKRAARDLEDAHKYGLEKFVSELLPIKDSMEMGLSHATDDVDVATLREGTEMTLKMLNAALDKFGVVEINPIGEKFDAQLHQAMTMQPTADAEPGTVLTVVQKGLQLNGRLVRPAMVIVAQAVTE